MFRLGISRKTFLIFSIPLFLITCLVILTSISGFRENAEFLSLALSFDLLILIPFVYFLLIRKTSIPKTTVLPLMILGWIIGKFIIPAENQYYLDLFNTWGIPIAELFVVGYVSFKVYSAIKLFKNKKENNADFYNVLKKTCKELFPRPVVAPLITEIAVFYYGFFNWKKRNLSENEFSYHKDSGSIALFSVIILLIIVETIVFHILVGMWNDTVALLLTLIGLYSILQLFGFTRSLSKRPISISEEKLFLKYGIMKETVIELRNIRSVEVSSRDIESGPDTIKLSLLGNLESHNVILYLNEEVLLKGLYGRRKKFRSIAFHVDETSKFREQIEAFKS